MKIERDSWVFISAYTPGCEKSEEEIEEFWSKLSECVGSVGRNESVVVHGNLNARVGIELIEGIVGRHGVPGKNESGERLLEMCAEQELVIGYSWFKKKVVYKYKWLRMTEGSVVDRALMDYMLLPKRMLGRLRCESVERRRWRSVSPFFCFFGGSSAEIGGWMEECREDGG